MKLFMTALYFGLCLQLSAYLCWAFQVFGSSFTYPINTDALNLTGVFDITGFNALIGLSGAAAIMIGGLLLRQGTYAVFAMLLWGIGAFFPIVSTFFLALPNTITALISATGASSDITNPLLVVVSAIFAFAATIYLFGLVLQREMV